MFSPCFLCSTYFPVWFYNHFSKEAHGLSGRVLDSRQRGRGFEPHWRHCVVSLSKTHISLLSTSSTKEKPSQHY